MYCPVCMETYDTSQHAPLVMSCGHTLCRTCVSALPTPRACPVCRQPETRSLSANPRNYALAEAAEAAKGAKQWPKPRAAPDDGRRGLDISELQLSATVLGRSSSGASRVVQGTYCGQQVGSSQVLA